MVKSRGSGYAEGETLHDYRGNNIRVKILELPTTLMNISKLDNAMAQAEIEKKEKRQREGIEAKKARGDWG